MLDYKSLTILLIEDNEHDAYFIKRILAKKFKSALTLHLAQTCAEGLELIKASQFDLIILDLSLPDSKELNALKRVRDIESNVPIVVVTGYDNEHQAISAVRMGAQDYINKKHITNDIFIKSVIYAFERQRNINKLFEIQEVNNFSKYLLGEEMTATVAHELNQPIAAISNYARGCLWKLRNNILPACKEQFIEVFEDIVLQSERAGNIIHKIRNLFKRQHEPEQVTSLEPVINKAFQVTKHLIDSNQIHFEISLQESQEMLFLDLVQIEQVLVNLIQNAVDAMQSMSQQEKVIKITAGYEPEENIMKLVISNNGEQISAERLPTIFEPFLTSKENGLGLGLAIVRKIIDVHNGEIKAVSDQQQTSFVIHLPICEEEELCQ